MALPARPAWVVKIHDEWQCAMVDAILEVGDGLPSEMLFEAGLPHYDLDTYECLIADLIDQGRIERRDGSLFPKGDWNL